MRWLIVTIVIVFTQIFFEEMRCQDQYRTIPSSMAMNGVVPKAFFPISYPMVAPNYFPFAFNNLQNIPYTNFPHTYNQYVPSMPIYPQTPNYTQNALRYSQFAMPQSPLLVPINPTSNISTPDQSPVQPFIPAGEISHPLVNISDQLSQLNESQLVGHTTLNQSNTNLPVLVSANNMTSNHQQINDDPVNYSQSQGANFSPNGESDQSSVPTIMSSAGGSGSDVNSLPPQIKEFMSMIPNILSMQDSPQFSPQFSQPIQTPAYVPSNNALYPSPQNRLYPPPHNSLYHSSYNGYPPPHNNGLYYSSYNGDPSTPRALYQRTQYPLHPSPHNALYSQKYPKSLLYNGNPYPYTNKYF